MATSRPRAPPAWRCPARPKTTLGPVPATRGGRRPTRDAVSIVDARANPKVVLTLLDLDFDQEQELLRQTVREVLARHSPLEVVRQMEDDPVGYPAALWTQLGELDLIGLLLPEEHGGSGMARIEGVALYEELGRALAPTPHFVSAVLGGGVLAAAGSQAQKERWLRPITSGEIVVTPAWLEPENGFSAPGADPPAGARGGGPSPPGGDRGDAGVARPRERLLGPGRRPPGGRTGDGPQPLRREAPRRLRIGGRSAPRAGSGGGRGRGHRTRFG